MRLRDVYLKAKAVADSCITSDHYIVAFDYLKVAQKYANKHAAQTRLSTDFEWAVEIEMLDERLIEKRSKSLY